MPSLLEELAAHKIQQSEQEAAHRAAQPERDAKRAEAEAIVESCTIAGMTYHEAIAESTARFTKAPTSPLALDIPAHLAAVEKRELERQEAPKQKGLFDL